MNFSRFSNFFLASAAASSYTIHCDFFEGSFFMTFYQELQLNQAGSKKVIRESETTQEKWRHILIYLLKIAITA